ncbi:SPFH domain-containing protein [Leucobacter sp. UT-8R-CII-1-4]|uniref:SPFH domain-containing protein n=1 Tax=Leucobacter sp. UT-8R-CII-1-4 TaxID=3040075 RepID=UPI0024A93165|nr:SPFH domain-containing protein [Leucobacter sp. UT-8R-CII-1-4]MDI6024549.1 SPFH domain-containing protein [Leucobacter sp. UT-8R-CII-1-4]
MTTNPPSAGSPAPTELEPVSTEPVGHDGIRVDISERDAWHMGSGIAITVFLASIVGFILGIGLCIRGGVLLDNGSGGAGFATLLIGIVLAVASSLAWGMLTIVAPGQTSVRQFFGRYVGTVRRDGISLVAPFTTGKKISVRVHNFETNELKVNDSDGNPIHIAAIVVWQVADTAKAMFAVEAYNEFIETQAEAALRHVATTHPYDQAGPGEQSLRGSTDVVSAELADEVAARVALAGLEVLEVRISSLAYAPEIAQAMLQRQQASAIIAAREKIVEGAVTMVEQALGRLENEGVVVLDDERRAQMVSNLLLVLTSEQRATPVINAGSLY